MSDTPKMNRHQRRRFAANFRRANIVSLPKPEGKTTGPCDWPGCSEPWDFVTMVGAGKDRKPAARRCKAHRLG